MTTVSKFQKYFGLLKETAIFTYQNFKPMSQTITAEHHSRIRQWILAGYDAHRVAAELKEEGHDDSSIELHVSEHRKALHAKKQYRGFIWLVTGAVLGFISCVLSLTNPVPELYYYILYGLTSIVVLILCYGLYLVFE